jgi:hypothetical protein
MPAGATRDWEIFPLSSEKIPLHELATFHASEQRGRPGSGMAELVYYAPHRLEDAGTAMVEPADKRGLASEEE